MISKAAIILTIFALANTPCQIQPVSDQEWESVRKTIPSEKHIEQNGSVYWVNPLLPQKENLVGVPISSEKNKGNAIDMLMEAEMQGRHKPSSNVRQINQSETGASEQDNLPEWGERRVAYHYSQSSQNQKVSPNSPKKISPTLRPSAVERKKRYARLYPNRRKTVEEKPALKQASTLSGLLNKFELPNRGVLTMNASLPHKFSDKGYGYKVAVGVRFPKSYLSIMFGNVWKGVKDEKSVSFTGYGLNYHKNLKHSQLIRFSAGTGVGYWSLSESVNFDNIVAEYYLMPNARIELGKTVYLFWDVGAYVGTQIEPLMNLGVSTDLASLNF